MHWNVVEWLVCSCCLRAICSDDSDDHDDESDDTDEGEEESPPPGHTEAEEDDSGDTMMQMMRLQGLVRSAGPEHSASLVRWLTHQRGPPSEIMRDFESLLRAGGGPPPHSVLHTPVPPMPARVPQASPVRVCGRGTCGAVCVVY